MLKDNLVILRKLNGYSQEQIDAMIAAGEATDTVRIG